MARGLCVAGGVSPSAAETPISDDSSVDWQRFSALVRRHRVAPLIHRSNWARSVGAPTWLLDELAREAGSAAVRALSLLAVQRDALLVLTDAGIDVIVLKGPPLAQEAYGTVAARHPGDLDLLVAPDRVVDAIWLLVRHGFEWRGVDLPASMRPLDGGLAVLERAASLPLVKEAILGRDGVRLDLHWRLTENPRLMPVQARWLTTPRFVEAASLSSPVLPSLPGWWFLMVHGTAHGWFRLKWLADLPMLAARNPELLSAPALEQTKRAGLERCVACGLRVADLLLGPFLPQHAACWARCVPGVDRLVRRSLDALTHPALGDRHVSPAELVDHLATRMALRSDRRYRLAEAHAHLLQAARAQLEPDPGVRALARGPLHWLARRAPGGDSAGQWPPVVPLSHEPDQTGRRPLR